MKNLLKPIYSKGFTLVEMAVVLVIIGLVLSGLLVSLSAQVEQKNFNENETTIDNIKEALLGYAMANGRFPCPAATPATGITAVEAFAGGGSPSNGMCAQFYNGFVPAITLGLSPTNTSGYILDGWNNPIRYAVFPLADGSTDSGGITRYLLTTTNGIKEANQNSSDTDSRCRDTLTLTYFTGMTYVGCKSLLFVCDASPVAGGLAASDCGTANSLSASTSSTTTAPRGGIILVVYSTGKNTPTGGTGTDEAANPNANSTNNDAVFVSHVPSAVGSTNGEFDDVVEWISANSVFAKLVQANQLP